METDEQLARLLQEEEDRATAITVAGALSHEPSSARGAKSDFEGRLEYGVRTVLAYELPEARALALSLIPAERLKKEADELRAVTVSHPKAVGCPPISRADAVLLRLLRWFKREFFTWCDRPACRACGATNVDPRGLTAPSAEERSHGADRVEAYTCLNCDLDVRFPRYNDAIKLLDTRTGRCGEWANVFSLCCRALGYDTRYVLDWTDHVWTGVWSESQGRWLHCDSCEESCDKPLLYESGWGKKLSYVVAFGFEGVVDVTRRYVVSMAETDARRTACDESWLRDRFSEINARLRSATDVVRLAVLIRRDASECAELEAAGQGGGTGKETLSGRTTGSLAWRAVRGELGPSRDAGKNGNDEPSKENSETTGQTSNRPEIELTTDASKLTEATAKLEVTMTPPAKDRIAAAVRAEFTRLVSNEGFSANEAAACAIRKVRRRYAETI